MNIFVENNSHIVSAEDQVTARTKYNDVMINADLPS